jgi:hypothetical protein
MKTVESGIRSGRTDKVKLTALVFSATWFGVATFGDRALQWGLDRLIKETSRMPWMRWRRSSLQWGLDRLIKVTSILTQNWGARSHFNGALID